MNFLSKKIFAIVLFSMLISANVFSQHSEREYKKYFDENREIFISYGFEIFLRLTFKDDNTFTIDGFDYHFCDGTYSFLKNTIKINYPFNYIDKDNIKRLKDFGLNCDKASEIIIDIDKSNIFNKGAYISGGKVFWSDKHSEPYKEYMFEGIKCIKYPKKIRIKENLKMRKTPSLKGELVHLDYYNYETKTYIEDRTVVFKDEEYKILARTVTEETIDGITSPWYLIWVEGAPQPPDEPPSEYAWIFGGYTMILDTE
ncbi:MAG: hypothetical protein IJJ71_06780 [Treponema sp.]|uniref:hypothetical protein n=1 Tax=Treponema sp. TaxID=166 RepID=UPI0025F84BDB|nr:hypothetical protein [Treponema sp.]MBR0495858.1 hypothetical protein [Treponema sp.]